MAPVTPTGDRRRSSPQGPGGREPHVGDDGALGVRGVKVVKGLSPVLVIGVVRHIEVLDLLEDIFVFNGEF